MRFFPPVQHFGSLQNLSTLLYLDWEGMGSPPSKKKVQDSCEANIEEGTGHSIPHRSFYCPFLASISSPKSTSGVLLLGLPSWFSIFSQLGCIWFHSWPQSLV
uniref:Uncharacterized protein n=1 Tax=Falco tinnunculus TaxID=100819 RepID=A0A8C4VCB7_FALTI